MASDETTGPETDDESGEMDEQSTGSEPSPLEGVAKGAAAGAAAGAAVGAAVGAAQHVLRSRGSDGVDGGDDPEEAQGEDT
jgi:hypothetical protein